MMDDDLSGRLKPGETVLWTGQPVPGRVARPGLILVAGAALGLLLYWNRGWAPRILLGALIVLAAAAALRAFRRASRTAYLVSQERLAHFYFGRRTRELSITRLEAKGWRLRRHADGTADVVLGNGVEFSAIRDPQVFEAAMANQLPPEEDKDPEKLPVPLWVARAAAAVACCLISTVLDALAWPLLAVGMVLLWRRSGLGLGARVAVTAVALLPRVGPAVQARLAGPGELSFMLAPPSASGWGWVVLLWSVAGLAVLALSAKGRAWLAGAGIRRAQQSTSAVTDVRRTRNRALLALPALALLAWATSSALGLRNDFEWIEPGAGGALKLRHTVRGTAATFLPTALEAIEGTEQKDAYRIAVRLKGGASHALTTGSAPAFGELKKLAATLELAPGRVRLRWLGGGTWTNAAFSLKSCAGVYEAPGAVRLEFRLKDGRLTGSETIAGWEGRKLTRSLRAIKVAEDGAVEFDKDAFAGAAGVLDFHFGGSRGTFLKEGLEIDGTRYVRR